MEISPSQVGAAVQMAVQAQLLTQAKAQGMSMIELIAGAPSPAGSVNLPSQGRHIDFRA